VKGGLCNVTQSILGVIKGLEPPHPPIFCWYLPYFARIWKIIIPLNATNFFTSDMMNNIYFWNPNFFVRLGFSICGSWYMVSSDHKRHHFGVYAFLWHYRFYVPTGTSVPHHTNSVLVHLRGRAKSLIPLTGGNVTFQISQDWKCWSEWNTHCSQTCCSLPDIPKDEFVSAYQEAVTYVLQNCKGTLTNLQTFLKSPPPMTISHLSLAPLRGSSLQSHIHVT